MSLSDAIFEIYNARFDLRRAQFISKLQVERHKDLIWRKMGGDYAVCTINLSFVTCESNDGMDDALVGAFADEELFGLMGQQ
jgi:hypothetical protein